MSNSLNSAGTIIAQRALDLLVSNYPALSLVASDFSDQGAGYGETVTTRVIPIGTASNFSSATGYVASDITTTAVNVTLNKHKHSTFSISAGELTTQSPRMIEDYASKVSAEIGDAVYSDIAALFTPSNYGFSTTCTLANVGFVSGINAANTALNTRKVPKNERVAIYNSTAYGNLWADDRITRSTASYGYQIGDSSLPVVQNTVLTDYPDLPTGNYLIGVQLHKSAVAIATRVPADVSQFGTPAVSNVSTVSHPSLGISLQVRTWEDPKFGSYNATATLIYGVAVGQSGAAQRIVTQ